MADVYKHKDKIVDTEFYGAVMNQIMRPVSPPQAVASNDGKAVAKRKEIDWSRADDNVKYLRELLSEVERRKMFAVMCLTPEKIAKSSASQLASMIKNLDDVCDDIKFKIRKVESRLDNWRDKKVKLSDDDKQRIDKFLDSAGGVKGGS